MKKSILLLFAVCTFAVITTAQPTLTSTNTNPVAGDVFNMNFTNYQSPGSSGASQTWNLSTMAVSSTYIRTFVSSSSTPYYSSFPGSTVAEDVGSGDFEYFITSSSALQSNGYTASSGSTIILYSNPEDQMRFPFAYTNTYTDNWSSIYTSSSITYYRNGTTTVTADGYGTLILPTGTFNNVLRVHFLQNYNDSSISGVTSVFSDWYMWYLPGNHTYIALVGTSTFNSTTAIFGIYLSNVLGIADENNSNAINIFPNPFSTQTTLQSNILFHNATLTVYNCFGQTVAQIKNISGQTIVLNRNNLASGLYFVRLTENNKTLAVDKLVITDK